MRTFVICLALAAAPAAAQEDAPGGEGLDLMERGLGMLMEGLGDEVAPMLRQLRELAGDLRAYEAPEMLPNGDIVIRRKEPLETPPEGSGGGTGDEVEL
jgi:hypothetical protein